MKCDFLWLALLPWLAAALAGWFFAEWDLPCSLIC